MKKGVFLSIYLNLYNDKGISYYNNVINIFNFSQRLFTRFNTSSIITF